MLAADGVDLAPPVQRCDYTCSDAEADAEASTRPDQAAKALGLPQWLP